MAILRAEGFRHALFLLRPEPPEIATRQSACLNDTFHVVRRRWAPDASAADIVLLNTCAIREKAEDKIWTKLRQLRAARGGGSQLRSRAASVPTHQIVGLLGCMAERLKERLLEDEALVDVIAGPDAYRDLPRLLRHRLETGEAAMNVQLSLDETYVVRCATDVRCIS
jgi:tRNA A37 methylthiotransferase MiaB